MLSAETLKQYLDYAIDAHANHPKQPQNAFRKWDGKTPYAAHPIWCATSILAEPTIDEPTRELGAMVLALHDVLEDTDAGLPSFAPPKVREYVRLMTFRDGDDERRNVWYRGEEIVLLKLYDKTHNLFDRSLIKPEKLSLNVAHALKLADTVEKSFGKLNVTLICRALCADA